MHHFEFRFAIVLLGEPVHKKDSIVDRVSAMEFCFLYEKQLIFFPFTAHFGGFEGIFSYKTDKSAFACPVGTNVADFVSFKGSIVYRTDPAFFLSSTLTVKPHSSEVCKHIVFLCVVESPDDLKTAKGGSSVGERLFVIENTVYKVSDLVLCFLGGFSLSFPYRGVGAVFLFARTVDTV